MEMEKIMIVDDSAFMRGRIRGMLKHAGFENFIEAANGTEAVEQYVRERPALTIMNITMPGMDGLQALKTITAVDPQAKIIMCTAISQESIMEQAIRDGANDYIVKPFDASRMIEAVKKQVGK